MKNPNQLMARLLEHEPSKWQVHESVVARFWNLKSSATLSVRDQTTRFLTASKKGGWGVKRNKTFEVMNSGAVDLAQDCNSVGVVVTRHGDDETFVGSPLSDGPTMGRPRFFAFGGNVVHVRSQLQLVRAVTGRDASLPLATRQRRSKLWRPWYTKFPEGREFRVKDLPMIAARFHELLGFIESEGGRLDRALLTCAEAQIREALRASNEVVPRTRSGRSAESSPGDKRDRSSSADRGAAASSSVSKARRRELPDYLRLSSLKRDQKLLIAIEYLVYLCADGVADGMDLRSNLDLVNLEVPYGIDLDELAELSARLLGSARANVTAARAALLEGQYFQPSDDEYLYEYFHDAARYSDGERLPAENFDLNPHTGKLWLTDEAAHYLRAIVFEFNLPMASVMGLWSYFSVLLLRRPLHDDELVSVRTMQARFFRLREIDRQKFVTSFEAHIGAQNEHGFYRYWYTSSDDSKHKDNKRHALNMSASEEVSFIGHTGQKENVIRHLTSGIAGTGDAESNATLNITTFEAQLSPAILASYGGGIADNAHDAQREVQLTFEKVIAYVSTHSNPTVAARARVYGVLRRCVKLGDSYHKDSLIVQHASNAAAGDTERDNHSFVHHRQCMESIHDINKHDRALSTRAMEAALHGSAHAPRTLRTWRERQQRWLVNQRFASYLLELLELTTVDGEPVLVVWAIYMYEHSDGWARRAAGEIVVMLFMPKIRVMLFFEKELGVFFEKTNHFHKSPGELGSRPGFRMMELHAFFFDFVAPFWEKAVQTPSERIPLTLAALSHIEGDDEREQTRKQIHAGLRAGHKELIKMYSELLRAPLVYLALTDPKRGPSLLRAVLSIAHARDVELGEGWGNYCHPPLVEPPAEQHWRQLLSMDDIDAETTVHFLHQFGLMQPVVRAELQQLSKEQPGTRGEKSSLAEFKIAYPIIYSALDAVFGQMLSTSLISEYEHGALRQDADVKNGASIEYIDTKRNYMSNNAYLRREERRRIVQHEIKERNATDGGTRSTAKVKHMRRKFDCIKAAEQLLETGDKYTEEVVKVLTLPTVRSLVQRGTRTLDKEAQAAKEMVATARDARRRRAARSTDEWKRLASEQKLGNDASWRTPAERRASQDLRRCAEIAFWRGLRVGTGVGGDFMLKLPLALPRLSFDGMEMMSKTALLPLIESHLQIIRRIASKQTPNFLSNDDVTALSEEEVLALFVKPFTVVQTICTRSRSLLSATSVLVSSSVNAPAAPPACDDAHAVASEEGSEDASEGAASEAEEDEVAMEIEAVGAEPEELTTVVHALRASSRSTCGARQNVRFPDFDDL